MEKAFFDQKAYFDQEQRDLSVGEKGGITCVLATLCSVWETGNSNLQLPFVLWPACSPSAFYSQHNYRTSS